ncbi:MAG: CBS domain-containing protein [Burkholderiaceae bacterium]|nr:CBS domain-containing protein [Burkholderiaceae bacterium]
MNIGSLCSRRIVTVDSACSLTEAATLMRERHVGSLVVTSGASDGMHVTGVVTDRDLVIRVLAQGLGGEDIDVGDLANQNLASVSEEDDVSHALLVMQQHGVRRLLVTNGDYQLTGIVTLGDLTAACARDMGHLAQVIRRGIDRETAETTPVLASMPPLRIPAMGTAGWGHVAA